MQRIYKSTNIDGKKHKLCYRGKEIETAWEKETFTNHTNGASAMGTGTSAVAVSFSADGWETRLFDRPFVRACVRPRARAFGKSSNR